LLFFGRTGGNPLESAEVKRGGPMAAFRIREFISSRPESMLDDPDRSVVAACHLTAPRGTVMRYSKVMPPDTHVVSVHLQSSSHHRFGISESVLHDGPAPAGTASFMASGQQIESVVSDGFDVLEVFIPCWWLDNIARRTFSGVGREVVARFMVTIGCDTILHHISCAILDCLHMPDQPMRIIQFNALSEAFAIRVVATQLAGRELPPTIRGGIASASLARIKRHVDDCMDEPLTLERLAAIAGLSQFHFARAFKISTGEAPHRYIQQRRMQRAHDLLRNTNLAIGDVSAAVGYDDPGHFAKIFRRTFGVTPSGCRREH